MKTSDQFDVDVDDPRFDRFCCDRYLLSEKLKIDLLGPIEKLVAWTFDWSVEQAPNRISAAVALIDTLNPAEKWNPLELDLTVRDVCRRLGLPDNPDRHETPHHFFRMFPIPWAGSRLDEYRTDPFDPARPLEFLTPLLFILWLKWLNVRIREWEDSGLKLSDHFETFLLEVHIVGLKLLAFTYPDGASGRISALRESREYLSNIHGLLDLKTDVLLDRNEAVRRHLERKWRRQNGH